MAMITISAFIYTYFQLVMWMIHCLHRHHHPCKLLLPSQLPATMKPQIITYCQCYHRHGPCYIAYSCFVVSILWMIWRHFHFRSQVWKCQKFKVHHVDASQGGWSSILFSSFCSLYCTFSLPFFLLWVVVACQTGILSIYSTTALPVFITIYYLASSN